MLLTKLLRSKRLTSFSIDFENMFHHHPKGPLSLDFLSPQAGQGDLVNKGREGLAHQLSSTVQVHVY